MTSPSTIRYLDHSATEATSLEQLIKASASPSWLTNSSVSTAEEPYSQKLTQLLKFLGLEVEGEQRVLLAKSGFKSDDISRNKKEVGHSLPTSAALVSTGFCLSDIDLLLEADALGLIYTLKLIKLESGLTAVETHLGFALMGKDTKINQAKSLSNVNEQNMPRSAMSMLFNQILSLNA
ncbi:hypothetical protein TNCV_1492111 [Trichonephila clavipes]|nr:hypothetical protein TNCV_1492111 [Trichonephila clavipes]